MDRAAIRRTLIRLVNQAGLVAPSIARFDSDRHYGRVTDERLDSGGYIAFEIEAEAALRDLALMSPRYETLHQRFEDTRREAAQFHSQSILVHRIRELMRAAIALIDADSSEPATDARGQALSLLAAIGEATPGSGEPVFVMNLARECGLSSDEVKGAWRYLRDHALIDTFSVPETARINARGIDALAAAEERRNRRAERPEAVEEFDRRNLPRLSDELREVLLGLWKTMLAAGKPLDLHLYQEEQPGSVSALSELGKRRCIASEEDRYRLTPLGLLSLDDPEALRILRLGDRIRLLLRSHFLNVATRGKPLAVTDLAHALGVPRADLVFALYQLSDALLQWGSFTPDFESENAVLVPGKTIREARSISDSAHQLAKWAAEYQPGQSLPPVEAIAPRAADPDETLVDRWLKWFKNNRVFAAVVFVTAVVIAGGQFTESLTHIKCFFLDCGNQASAPPHSAQAIARKPSGPSDSLAQAASSPAALSRHDQALHRAEQYDEDLRARAQAFRFNQAMLARSAACVSLRQQLDQITGAQANLRSTVANYPPDAERGRQDQTDLRLDQNYRVVKQTIGEVLAEAARAGCGS